MRYTPKPAQRLIPPRARFDGKDAEPDTIAFRDDDHTPYTKRAGGFEKSWSQFEIIKCFAGGWVEVRMEETTTSKKSHTQTRVITMTIPAAIFVQMVEFAKEGFEPAAPSVIAQHRIAAHGREG